MDSLPFSAKVGHVAQEVGLDLLATASMCRLAQ
jgi:hypothetical protein